MHHYTKLGIAISKTSKARNGYTHKGRKKKEKPEKGVILLRNGKRVE